MKIIATFTVIFCTLPLLGSTFPLNSIAGTPARAPIDSLKAITRNSQYQTCKADLQHFLRSLSPNDEKDITSLREKFDAKKLKSLLTAKKREFPTAAPQEITINQNMKSGHFLVVHGRLKCQISIYTEFDSDGVKANVDPTASDVKINEGLIVEAALVGASADATAMATPHMDPSKVLTILKVKLDVPNQSEQIKILEQLHETEESSQTATPANTRTK